MGDFLPIILTLPIQIINQSPGFESHTLYFPQQYLGPPISENLIF